MSRLSLVILLAAVAVSCSSRVEYQSPVVPAPPNAININIATVANLETLPGIGPGTAAAIVEFRSANGPFRRRENLMLVRGVSEKRFLEIRPLLRTE